MIENEAKTVENLTETDKLDMVTGGVASRVDPYAKKVKQARSDTTAKRVQRAWSPDEEPRNGSDNL